MKHSVKCDFVSRSTATEGSPRVGLSHANSPGTSVHNTENLSGSAQPLDFHNGIQSSSLNLQDLELMHHYSIQTASTLHRDPTIRTLLRVEVPRCGLKHDFVLRGVLAISALHLARFTPGKRDYYIAQAAHHQEIGLRDATSLLANINEDNCSAVYIFTMFTLFNALASPRKTGDLLITGKHGVADWMFWLKGCKYIMESSYPSLLTGPFGPLFKAGKQKHETREVRLAVMPPMVHPIDDLFDLIQKKIFDVVKLHDYAVTIKTLRDALLLGVYQDINFEGGELFAWLFQVPEGFLQSLKEETQESLTILGFFCVLLKRSEHHWWLDGWSVHLLARIYEILDLEHRLWIRWPIEEIGWVPH